MLQNNPVTGIEVTRWVEEQAQALGFDLCGVAPAEEFPELERLPEWLARGYAGEMDYLRDARRGSPARVLPGARSLIVCALNYNTALPCSTEVPQQSGESPKGWISRYAWGDDYHEVLRSKLEALVAAMRAKIAEPFEARAYVDTGPVVERVAAKHAGLGWLAKNTCLINPQLGSWLFLAVILTTLELAPSLGAVDALPPDLCGNCTLCLDACPTGAIIEPYLLDARRCISYLTIELRGAIPVEFRAAMGRHVFGCDICQDVCPWNRTAPMTHTSVFLPRRVARAGEYRNSKEGIRSPNESADQETLFAPPLEWLASLREEEFPQVFRGSTIKRAKWRGLVRNACVALGNCGARLGTVQHTRIVALLDRIAASEDALIAEHARWAIGRLCSR